MKRGPHNLWIPYWDNHAHTIAQHSNRYFAFFDLLNTQGTAVDAGAHVGYWTTKLAEDYNSVIAFECKDENLECLRRNVEEDVIGNVEIFPYALSDEAQPGNVVLNPGQDTRNSGAWHFEPSLGPAESIRLDDVAIEGPVKLIKMDIEGMEERALRGAEETIKRDRPAIILEVTTTASGNYGMDDEGGLALLRSWGYVVRAVLGRDFLLLPGEA